ncbi:hypothetical protein SDC9_184304 [bioreactor metagenome]|uniref:Uncharacterized protein n=1 Tax=bioreactor metagenome TaxID=1076179 RepID=A0A645HMW5_9ZZZZ
MGGGDDRPPRAPRSRSRDRAGLFGQPGPPGVGAVERPGPRASAGQPLPAGPRPGRRDRRTPLVPDLGQPARHGPRRPDHRPVPGGRPRRPRDRGLRPGRTLRRRRRPRGEHAARDPRGRLAHRRPQAAARAGGVDPGPARPQRRPRPDAGPRSEGGQRRPAGHDGAAGAGRVVARGLCARTGRAGPPSPP